MQVEMERGRWIDRRGAEAPLESWAAEFLSLARGLSPTTQETCRDLERYVLPLFDSYHLGRLPADEIENWPNDEIAGGLAASSVHRHYSGSSGAACYRWRSRNSGSRRTLRPGGASPDPEAQMVFLTWEQTRDLAEAHSERYRALIYMAVDSGMRWSELVGLRRGKLDLRFGKVRVTEQLIRLSPGEWLRKEPTTPSSIRSITISPVTLELLADHVEPFSGQGPDGLVFANKPGPTTHLVELPEQPLHACATERKIKVAPRLILSENLIVG